METTSARADALRPPEAMRVYAKLVRRHPVRVTGILVLATLSAGLMMLDPWLLRIAVDHIVESGGGELMFGLGVGGAFFLIHVLAGGADYLRSWLGAQVGSNVAHTLRRRGWYGRAARSLPELQGSRAGDSAGFVGQVESVRATLTGALPFTAHDAATLVAALITVLLMEPWVATVTIAVPPIVLIYYRAMVRRMAASRRQRDSLTEVDRYCARWLFPPVLILARVMGREQENNKRFDSLSSQHVGRDVAIVTARDLAFVMGAGATAVMGALTIVLSFWLEVTAGTFTAFMYLTARLLTPVTHGLERLGSVAETVAKLDPELTDPEVTEGNKPKPAPARVRTRTLHRAPAALRFRGVSYEIGGFVLVSDLELLIQPQERVAIVGPVGAGKSTIGHLAAGLLDPTAGVVEVNGVDLRELDPAWLPTAIGYQLQRPSLFDGTLRDNLTVERPFTDAAVEQASRLAGLDEHIRRLPDGLQTKLGTQATLSGGQQKLLAFARTVLWGCPNVLLDEPLTDLDHGSACRLEAVLGTWTRGRTLVLITHAKPPAWIDRVITLEAPGRIVRDVRVGA